MTSTIMTTVDSPVGPLRLTASDGALTGVYMSDQRHAPTLPDDLGHDDSWFAAIATQLDAYFHGDLTAFDVPMNLHGTDFQCSVWKQLSAIPYGETISYGELARRVGNPKASRAVGLANGRNPISIIVPCHRVIGANGSLTGYGGGLERKTWLLQHEATFRR
jgi:O-6-methylguanine DNA methyltransferase